MTKITKTSVMTGLALIALGIGFFIASGMDWNIWTPLIPALFIGLPILFCGLLARNEKRRMMAAHIAVLVGIIGILGGLGMGIPKAIKEGLTLAPTEQLIMAAICLLYVAACVRSFIAARKD